MWSQVLVTELQSQVTDLLVRCDPQVVARKALDRIDQAASGRMPLRQAGNQSLRNTGRTLLLFPAPLLLDER